ncbi:MAG: hypothetical protein U0Q22_19075 [Acidimicrobiales bacterium]
MIAGSAPADAISDAVDPGSTRTSNPPWPLAATARLPSARNATPPNMRRSDHVPA